MNMRNIVIRICEVLVMFNLAFAQTTPPGSTAELTGIVTDATCQRRHNRKAVTRACSHYRRASMMKAK